VTGGFVPGDAPNQCRRAIVGRLTHEAALRGELLVCACRFVFCALVLFRFWALHLAVPAYAVALKVGTSLLAMAFSLWMWSVVRRGRCTALALRLSVMVDAVMCGACLLGTAVWPGIADYGGLMTRPEPMAILIMIYTSGFRLSPKLAALGGVANTLSAAILLCVDRAVAGHPLRYGPAEIFFFGLAVASAAVLAVATAIITRRLVEAVSREVARVDTVRHQLTHIVRDQHDAKTLLATATLNADLVRRALDGGPAPTAGPRTITLVEDLRSALDVLHGTVARLNDRATGQLAVLREPIAIDTAAVLPAALPLLAARFPDVEIVASLGYLPVLRVLGGRGGLERALLTVVLNAVEGDGRRGARRIDIATRRSGRSFELVVTDDGPGFPSGWDRMPRDGHMSGKPRGSGVGLYGLAQLAEASGGALDVRNAPSGGAEVVLSLPARADAAAWARPWSGAAAAS